MDTSYFHTNCSKTAKERKIKKSKRKLKEGRKTFANVSVRIPYSSQHY